jgi:hypothetical protein
MCGRAVFRRTLLAVLLLTFVSCYDDDDDGGPTGPPVPVPRIAGIWSGLFSADEGGESVAIFDLVQNGRDVSGVVSVGAVAWPLEGDVDSRGVFRWRTGGGTCGSFDGSTDLTTATNMVGRAELDRFFCPERERLRGDVDLILDTRR